MQFNYPDFRELTETDVFDYFVLAPDSPLGSAVKLSKTALDHSDSLMPSSLAVLDILRQLGADETTQLAAVLADSRLNTELDQRLIGENYGRKVADLVESTRWLHSFRDASHHESVPEQVERLRRLLMQAVSDVRAILIKLAYRVERMRNLQREPEAVQHNIAQETMDLYAPLANRLGIGQLKWELEDFSFRFLEPESYKHIAKSLEERRQDRENYLRDFVAAVRDLLQSAGIQSDVAGRPKHIYSIVKKMRRKSLSFEQLFDVRAVRIIVESLADCYAVLGLVHNAWPSIKSEFDDYIANPKGNGYQSLHTVVVGPNKRAVEIQIRTREMHELAESGVAAHWRYKEQHRGDDRLERNVQALRQLLAQDEVNEELLSEFQHDLTNDRVYVFTPDGDVVDLVAGATPLDFAYAVHTEVGHRCRGAKVNGRIVPLNYALNNADQVEIITAREGGPTREWLNPQLGYLHSSHARAKVRGWFNRLNQEQYLADGRHAFERELNRFHGRSVSDETYAAHFGFESVDEFCIALGQGRVTNNQLIGAIQLLTKPVKAEPELPAPERRREAPVAREGAVSVQGVGNLMTQFANCCKPIPGDPIIGFITRGRGVSIHRQNCSNIRKLPSDESARLIAVEWGIAQGEACEADVVVEAYDREGLLRDVSAVLAKEHIHLNAVTTHSDRQQQIAVMRLTIELKDSSQLGLVMDKLGQIPNVFDVKRAHNA